MDFDLLISNLLSVCCQTQRKIVIESNNLIIKKFQEIYLTRNIDILGRMCVSLSDTKDAYHCNTIVVIYMSLTVHYQNITVETQYHSTFIINCILLYSLKTPYQSNNNT